MLFAVPLAGRWMPFLPAAFFFFLRFDMPPPPSVQPFTPVMPQHAFFSTFAVFLLLYLSFLVSMFYIVQCRVVHVVLALLPRHNENEVYFLPSAGSG
jgi:hypothetical protein